ncbi:hypothetical protein L810_7891 [Burkholderia sp. AU4i]|nr:hypothetical protein L810_7891 [Burkholderia sp. AU4i]
MHNAERSSDQRARGQLADTYPQFHSFFHKIEHVLGERDIDHKARMTFQELRQQWHDNVAPERAWHRNTECPTDTFRR